MTLLEQFREGMHPARRARFAWYAAGYAWAAWFWLSLPAQWQFADANADLQDYHAYTPAALLNGTWTENLHPGGVQSYFTPYIDLLVWPLVGIAPSALAVVALLALHLLALVPVALILRLVAPHWSRPTMLAATAVAGTGAMYLSELGTTFGDILASTPALWGLYFILRAFEDSESNRRILLGGALIGLSIALKLTLVYLLAALLPIAWFATRKFGATSGIKLLLAAGGTAVVAYLPWGLFLWAQTRSPFYPLLNRYFQAPYFPASNLHDDRYGAQSVIDVLLMPVRAITDPGFSAERPFADARWLLAAFAAVFAIYRYRRTLKLRTSDVEPQSVARAALVWAWLVGYIAWAYLFGIQRYAIALELLAFPVLIAALTGKRSSEPSSRTARALMVASAIAILATTQTASWGRQPVSAQPIIPAYAIPALAKYSAVVLGHERLGYLVAMDRDSSTASKRLWIGAPFNQDDAGRAKRMISGRNTAIAYREDSLATAEETAAALGLTIGSKCSALISPLDNERLEICDTKAAK